MKARTTLLLIAAVGLGIAITIRLRLKPVTDDEAKHASPAQSSAAVEQSPMSPALARESTVETSQAEPLRNTAPKASFSERKQVRGSAVVPAPQPVAQAKEPLRDPEARLAMSLVGIDPEAEAYWLDAIFDTDLPEKEREDLMEDLNEDGLSDFKQPGPEDWPLIVSRLLIIEEVAPYADEFMAAHLGEAYKDLMNLAAITQGGGDPVR